MAHNLQNIAADILYEDNHLIAVNKHPSDIVQGDKTGDVTLKDIVAAYIGEKYDKPGKVFLGVVHRIDRPVSGAVLFARTGKALARLNEMLSTREIQKRYWAIVIKEPPQAEDILVHHLKKNEAQNKSYVSTESAHGALRAELSYRMLAASDRYFLLEVDLKTGRHHQIRAQLAAIGCQIKGDLKYGAPRPNPGGFIHLHARTISFLHPVKKEPLMITAPLPYEHTWNLFRYLEA
jgi:23S rRNA pseudouridine1911/1915/1917 synthase